MLVLRATYRSHDTREVEVRIKNCVTPLRNVYDVSYPGYLNDISTRHRANQWSFCLVATGSGMALRPAMLKQMVGRVERYCHGVDFNDLWTYSKRPLSLGENDTTASTVATGYIWERRIGKESCKASPDEPLGTAETTLFARSTGRWDGPVTPPS